MTPNRFGETDSATSAQNDQGAVPIRDEVGQLDHLVDRKGHNLSPWLLLELHVYAWRRVDDSIPDRRLEHRRCSSIHPLAGSISQASTYEQSLSGAAIGVVIA